MKTCLRGATLRSKQFMVTEKARKVATMETMIAEFDGRANDLMRQIADEEERTRVKNCDDLAYSTFAKATRLRRNNLLKSADDLKIALYTARREYENAAAELTRPNSASKLGGPLGAVVGAVIGTDNL
jgi:flagellar FliJ protein